MIGIYWHQNGTDYSIENGRLAQDDGLNSMIYMLLMTDARASDSDELPHGASDRRGWPGDSFAAHPWGSRLWLLKREKLTTQTIQRAQDYAQEALIPLLKGYAKRYSVMAVRDGRELLHLDIRITKPDGEEMTYSLSLRWNVHSEVSHAV